MEALACKEDSSQISYARIQAAWQERMQEWSEGEKQLQHLMKRRLKTGRTILPASIQPTMSSFSDFMADKMAEIPISTIEQPSFLVEDASKHHRWPERTKLRTRRAQRCGTCDKYLIKPEAKMNSTEFKIRAMAMSEFF